MQEIRETTEISMIRLVPGQKHPWRMPLNKQQDVTNGDRIPCCIPINPTGSQTCGKISFYRVLSAGFCERHKDLAYEAQANYWRQKYTELSKKLRRQYV